MTVNMKEHILPQQAKEVKEQEFYSLFDEIVHRRDWATYHHKKVTIGKMILWLNGVVVSRLDSEGMWLVETVSGNSHKSEELVNALWDTVKIELSNRSEVRH